LLIRRTRRAPNDGGAVFRSISALRFVGICSEGAAPRLLLPGSRASSRDISRGAALAPLGHVLGKITPSSFHWTAREAAEGSDEWRVHAEFFLERCAEAPLRGG
jgi:hypothetical protein